MNCTIKTPTVSVAQVDLIKSDRQIAKAVKPDNKMLPGAGAASEGREEIPHVAR
jgi:hypothetical protein